MNNQSNVINEYLAKVNDYKNAKAKADQLYRKMLDAAKALETIPIDNVESPDKVLQYHVIDAGDPMLVDQYTTPSDDLRLRVPLWCRFKRQTDETDIDAIVEYIARSILEHFNNLSHFYPLNELTACKMVDASGQTVGFELIGETENKTCSEVKLICTTDLILSAHNGWHYLNLNDNKKRSVLRDIVAEIRKQLANKVPSFKK